MNRLVPRSAFVLALLLSLNTFATTTSFYEMREGEEKQGHAHVLTPEEEKAYYKEAELKGDFQILDFRFEQTDWRECTDEITGNYSGYNCVNRRGIATILKTFMDDHMPFCVQEALDVVDGGELDKLHIIHDGILGDRRHSPRSMHAENRAVDIDSFVVTTYDGRVKKYLYEDEANRDFYVAFRECWGKVVHDYNGCPYYANTPLRTGSIGWEDSGHQHHMHTSVPYCVNGSYGSYYYNR